MKKFIYTYSEKSKETTYKTVKVYRVTLNEPVFIGSLTDTYVAEFQLVMMALEKFKALPKKAFIRNQFGGYEYPNAWYLKNNKIATVVRV